MPTARGVLGRLRRGARAGVQEFLAPASPPPPGRPLPDGVALSDGRVLVQHPVASHMIADGFCLLVTPRVLHGTYEPAVTAFLRSSVRPGDTVVDIGANQGFHTLTLGMGVLPGGHVWAFEPHPHTRRVLSDNIATNFLHHTVTVVEAAAWNADGELTFRARTGEAAGSYLLDAYTIPGDVAEGEDIQVRTIDTGAFLAGLPSPPNLIKLDAEGSEPEILRAAADVLREHHPTIVMEVLCSTFASVDELAEWETWLREDLGYDIALLDAGGMPRPAPPGAFRSLTHGAEVALNVPGGRGAPG
jgi:FkbM family methyltransferase